MRLTLSKFPVGWLVAAICAALVVATRLPAFFMSAPHPDESLFLIMGREWLRGAAPYTTTWDHHPVGAAGLFALAQLVFGQSFVAIRVLTVLAVTAECLLLYGLGNRLSGQGRFAGVVAATAYAVYSLNNLGQAAHRELFFAPLMTGAVYLWMARPRDDGFQRQRLAPGRLLGLSLLLGVGLQLKYLYILDCLALALIVALDLFLARSQPNRLRRVLVALSTLAAGTLLIVGGLVLYYALIGQLGPYLEANFLSGAAYAGSGEWGARSLLRVMVQQVTGSPLAWLGLLFAPLYLLLVRDVAGQERRRIIDLAIWFTLAFAGTLLTGSLFGHYFLQLLPPLLLLTGVAFAGVVRRATMDGFRQVLLVSLVLLPALLPRLYGPLVTSAGLLYNHYVQGEPWPKDTPTIIAAYLEERVPQDQEIYVMDYEPVIYYLVDRPLPTRYVFTPHMMDAVYQQIAGFDQVVEIDRIMARAPLYVLRLSPSNPGFTNKAVAERLEEHLTRSYGLERTLDGTSTTSGRPIAVQLYRRSGSN